MHIFLAAIDREGYNQLYPLTTRKSEIFNLEIARRRGTLKEPIKLKDLLEEDDKLEGQIVYIGARVGKQKVNLFETDQEVSAYEDLIYAFQKLHPEKHQLFLDMGECLIPADTLKKLYGEFTRLLATINLEDLIRNHAAFRENIPKQAYYNTLEKQKRILEFCVQNGYALLKIVTGEI